MYKKSKCWGGGEGRGERGGKASGLEPPAEYFFKPKYYNSL